MLKVRVGILYKKYRQKPKKISYFRVKITPDSEQLAQLAGQNIAGKVKVFADSTLPLEQIQDALGRFMAGHLNGKPGGKVDSGGILERRNERIVL